MNSKVSIIMPAYNAAGSVARALESILNQDYKNIEAIVVNDGSTDDTEAVLSKYIQDKRLRYVKTENKGVSHAINEGLKRTTGDYVSFLHADDLFLSGKLRKQVSLMEKAKKYGVSYTNTSYFLENTRHSVLSSYSHFSGDIFYFLKRNNFIHASSTMIRKDIAKNIKFDESLGCHEEWDVFLKLARKGVKFLFIDEVLSKICVHKKALSEDTPLMDKTRLEVGLRAKALWHDFKKSINVYSKEGIISFKRYISFKTYALSIGFPKKKKFNLETPKETLAALK